jgi:hypothetical protein
MTVNKISLHGLLTIFQMGFRILGGIGEGWKWGGVYGIPGLSLKGNTDNNKAILVDTYEAYELVELEALPARKLHLLGFDRIRGPASYLGKNASYHGHPTTLPYDVGSTVPLASSFLPGLWSTGRIPNARRNAWEGAER